MTRSGSRSQRERTRQLPLGRGTRRARRTARPRRGQLAPQLERGRDHDEREQFERPRRVEADSVRRPVCSLRPEGGDLVLLGRRARRTTSSARARRSARVRGTDGVAEAHLIALKQDS